MGSRWGVLVALLALLATTGCAGSEVSPVAVPVFVPDAGTDGGADPASVDPFGCPQLLPHGEVEALLALPIDALTLRQIEYAPDPAIGRTSRVGCRYQRVGADGALQATMTVGEFHDAAAARAQWELNSRAQQQGRPSHDHMLGAVPAVLVEQDDGLELIAVHGPRTVTVTLAGTAVAVPGTEPTELITDLARRALARLPPPG